MEPIDKEKFGAFLSALRKEKKMTQRGLGERLFVSDKAVSKWERGHSMPDVALLTPLAEILGVTVTELLRGGRIETPEMAVEQVEELVSGAIHLSREERDFREKARKHWRTAWVACAAAAAVEGLLLSALGLSGEELMDSLLLVEGLCLAFGFYFCWFAKERIPAYYDENKINFYSDGIFRMNLPGVRFHNSNWPHILKVGRLWMLWTPVVFPLLYLAVRARLPADGMLVLQLVACLGFFVPVIAVGKKYE